MTPPLNIVFVYADQLHAFALGCMGNADIETPHLDALAARGTLFQRCYTSNPVCTPYRVALFTGRYTSQTGIINNLEVPIPEGEVTLADSLNAGGYRTSYVGKWHIGGSGNVGVPPHLRAGFTDFIGYQCYNDFYRDLWFFDENGEKDERHGHRTAVTTDIALERLARIKDAPFAMCVSYQNPHYPVQPSREYAERYWDRPITLRPNFHEIERAFLAGGRAYPREQDPDFLRRGDDTVSYIKMYYAMVAELDTHIGRMVAQLDAWKLLERTLIVFTSDHGDMQGSHGLGNKHVPYEESTRVPLIVYDPLGTPGRVSDQLVDTVDFLPSLLEYAGCPPSPLQEGQSFLRITRGAPDDPNKPAFVEQYGYLMIVKGRHKLVVQRHTFVPTDLFDLVADPYEMRNLVTDPAHASVREALAAEIATWYAGIIRRQNPNRVPDYTAEQPQPWETKVPPVRAAVEHGEST